MPECCSTCELINSEIESLFLSPVNIDYIELPKYSTLYAKSWLKRLIDK